MTNKKANTLILLVLSVFVLYNIIFPPNPDDRLTNRLIEIAISIIASIILVFLLKVVSNINRLWFFLQTEVFHRNRDIRISIAYLYRIKVNDKYLLVKNRHRNYFQPVGGVYKTLPGSEKVFEKLGVRSDRLIETSKGISKGDLRVYVKGNNVLDFLEWFGSKEDREISPWREFCEELVSTDILPHKPFRYIDYKFKGTIQTPIIKLDSGDLGFFIYDIFDFIPNNEQLPILEQIEEKGNAESYLWADEYLIQRLGHDERHKVYEFEISPHTKWAHNLKWEKI